jgi:hypothetical protein
MLMESIYHGLMKCYLRQGYGKKYGPQFHRHFSSVTRNWYNLSNICGGVLEQLHECSISDPGK